MSAARYSIRGAPRSFRSRWMPSTSEAARTPPSASTQPSRASARAIPRPMPRVPPVTRATRSGMRWTEEGQVRRVFGEALHIERRFARVIVAPLARLTARNPGAWRHVVPTVRPVIDGMQQQPLVVRIDAHIRFIEDRFEHAEAGLLIPIRIGIA